MTYGATDASRTTTMAEDGTDGQVATRDPIPSAANTTQAAEALEAGLGGATTSARHQTDGSVISPGGVAS
jgi:hypothetical protein